MAKEIPILFSTPMVQAILDGRKTMTRRVVKFPLKCPTHQLSIGDSDNPPPVLWSKWSIGDILWVRESWRKYFHVDEHGYTHFDKQIIEFAADNPPMIYQKDGDGRQVFNRDGTEKFIPWKPSIHMPKEACRIWLEVTNVRVERLHDMDGATADECDSLKEGIMKFHHGDGNYGYHWKGDMDGKNFVHPFDAFVDLWKSINGPESWAANPWVWVVEFKVLSTTGKPAMSDPLIEELKKSEIF